MKKKLVSTLKLNRETLRTLNAMSTADLVVVAPDPNAGALSIPVCTQVVSDCPKLCTNAIETCVRTTPADGCT